MSNGIDINNRTPLYIQIVKDLKNRVESGELKVGAQIDSHQELAKRYNVSLITIKGAISNLVNEGILIVRPGKGTFVAENQVNKVDLSKHKTIGLVLRDLKHQYFSLIVNSIEERAYELGFNLLLSSSSGSIQKEESQIAYFQELGVDGLIIASLSFEYKATDYIQKLHRDNFPYVMVSYIHDPEYWYVGSNHEIGGYIATNHLIKLGYQSIGFLHVGKGNLLSDVRKNGYALALQENNIPFDSKLIFYLANSNDEMSGDRYNLGYQFGQQFKSISPKPDALLVYSDVTALGLELSLLEQGINIPQDVAIVGYDDVIFSRYAAVPLTTIHQPADKIGRAAVEIIQKRINGEDVGNRTIFKPHLVIRDSCGAKQKGMFKSVLPHLEEVI